MEEEDRLVVGVEHVDVHRPFLLLVRPGVLVHPDHARHVVVDGGEADDPCLRAGTLSAAGNLLTVDPERGRLLAHQHAAADELAQRVTPVLVLLSRRGRLREPGVGVRPGHPQEAVGGRQHRRPRLLLVDHVVGRSGDAGGQLGQRSERGEGSQHGHGGHGGSTPLVPRTDRNSSASRDTPRAGRRVARGDERTSGSAPARRSQCGAGRRCRWRSRVAAGPAPA